MPCCADLCPFVRTNAARGGGAAYGAISTEGGFFNVAIQPFVTNSPLQTARMRPARGPLGWRAQSLSRPQNGENSMNENSVDLWRDDRFRVSVAEGARLLSISKRMLEYRIAAKQIRTVRDGHRVFILISDLRGYARTNHYDSPRPRKPRK